MAQVSIREQLLPRIVQRFRGGLVLKVHRLCASRNSGLESNKEEYEEEYGTHKTVKARFWPWLSRESP